MKTPSSLPSLFINRFFPPILLLITLAAYQPALQGSMLWDDDAHITKPSLRSLSGLARIWIKPGATQQYYPLVHSLFWMQHRLWGDGTLGYHLVTILLHFLSALLLLKILRLLKVTAAWFVAALFALHPVQVESVAWITELKNTLSGVFFFGAALVFLRFDEDRKIRLYAAALVLFILGLLSKSVIATLPVSLLAIFWWKRGTLGWKRDLVPLLPFFLLGIVAGLFTARMERVVYGAEGAEFNFSIIERCLIAGRSFWFYLGKLVWPADLLFIYQRWNVSQAVWWQYLFPAAALGLAAFLWKVRKRSRAFFSAFLCYAAAIFPVMGFFNVYPFRFSFVADHFQYLACTVPLALLTAGLHSAAGLTRGKEQRFITPMIFGILLVTLGVLTWKQSGMYADIETLYRTTIRKNPSCWMACHNLAKILGKTSRTGEAIILYRKAIEARPGHMEARNNLGNLLRQTGRPDEAIAEYQKALAIDPNLAETHNNLGLALAQAGRLDEAIVHYSKALDINPDKISALNNMAGACLQKGKFEEAVIFLERARAVAESTGKAMELKGIENNLEKLREAMGSVNKNQQ